MTDAQMAKWGERYGITLDDVRRLGQLLQSYATNGEHECNGDPHPDNPRREDKNLNSKLWGRSNEAVGLIISRTAKRLGFDGVDFGPGLYPVLIKGQDTCIMVPQPDDDD